MGFTPNILFLVLGLTTALGITVLEQNSTQLLPTSDIMTTDIKKPSMSLAPVKNDSRRGRHIHIDVIHLPISGNKAKRQIIKIPNDVSKVKLIRPPLYLRKNKAPQIFKKQFSSFREDNLLNPTKQHLDNFNSDQNDYELYDPKKAIWTMKRFREKESIPQELFFQDKIVKRKKEQPVLKPKTKQGNKLLENYFLNYELEAKKEKPKEKENHHDGYESSATSIHLKQIPAPNLFPFKTISSTEMGKQPQALQDENYIPGLSIKKLPTKGRQMQSIFSQQYTSHNPHVATNFGLSGFGTNGLQYIEKETVPYGSAGSLGKFSHPLVAASNQLPTSVPVLSPGIQVIQPPQFRDVTVSQPSHPSRLVSSQPQPEETSSQRATIRDILEQDCPAHESKGYCESPPRYPMQQISNMVKKCGNFLEMMNTQPFEEPQDVFTFARRSDSESNQNNSSAVDNNSSWSRSSTEEATACFSDITLTEPGYAREIISGRWFVVVQHPDTTIQRISTDTCRSPGKPCAGLTSLKCSRNKATTCVQRYTYQRLISWDPEAPEGCPRIRLFRFPSACVCHLALV